MTDELKSKILQGFMQGATFENSSPNIIIGDGNTVTLGSQEKNVENQKMPETEALVKAVEATAKAGLWWGNTSWSVVFRVMQMMGYSGKISQFVKEVEQWPLDSGFQFRCNADAISKPLRSGKITRSLSHWHQDGAPKQYITLANALKNELEEE